MYDPTSEQALRERHFVEELGHMFADLGAVPMMGRVMGRLLICDPPEQSLTELSEYLGASKGSISTTARQMLAAGMIQKVPRPGDRAHYYRISDDAIVRVRFEVLQQRLHVFYLHGPSLHIGRINLKPLSFHAVGIDTRIGVVSHILPSRRVRVSSLRFPGLHQLLTGFLALGPLGEHRANNPAHPLADGRLVL